MDRLDEPMFTFTSQALPPDKFTVVRFKGDEGLSRSYEFDILLASEDPDVDPEDLIYRPATLTIRRDQGDLPFHGWLSLFEQGRQTGHLFLYRAVLVPKLFWLGYTHHQQIFLSQSLPEFLSAVLKDGGLANDDYELRLKENYQTREYVCQYDESHLDFVNRWLERDGLYYFFEQGQNKEKLIITDSAQSHAPRPDLSKLQYSPRSGLEGAHLQEVVSQIDITQHRQRGRVRVKDYNYRTPSLALNQEAEVSPDGLGEFYVYGGDARNPDEIKKLARVRAEEYKAAEKIYSGSSSIPYISPGYLYDLSDHYRSDANGRLLVTGVHHQGRQVGYLLEGMGRTPSEEDRKPLYQNRFQAMPAAVQFRPEPKTPKPRVSGSLPAHVDSAGSGQYAELDDQGRYKIRMPFDLSGRSAGKASHRVRLAQPYAGEGYGFHTPLHKGTEVLVTFIDGDPDRPVIASAVPNPETAGPVKDSNQTKSILKTGGSNRLEIEDRSDQARIHLSSPNSGSLFTLGKIHPDHLGGSSGGSGSGGGGTGLYRPDEFAPFIHVPGPVEPWMISAVHPMLDPALWPPQNNDDMTWLEKLQWLFEQMGKGLGKLFSDIGDGIASLWNANAKGTGWQPLENHKDGFAISNENSWGKYVGQDLSLNIGGNMCKIILGAEEQVIVGLRMRVIAALLGFHQIILGGRLIIRAPAKYTWKNIKDETEAEKMHALQEKIDAANVKIQAVNTKVEAVDSKAHAFDTQVEAAGQKTELLDTNMETVNERTVALGESLTAADEAIEAVNIQNRAAGTHVSTLESKVEAVNTQIATLGAQVQQATEVTEAAAALKVDSADLVVQDAEEQDL